MRRHGSPAQAAPGSRLVISPVRHACVGGPQLNVREKLRRVVESRAFQHTITVVILLNAISLGCETSPWLTERYATVLHVVDVGALAIFVVELALRLFVYRLGFFRDPWNVFDLAIVSVALLPASAAFSVLRAMRILRVLRLVSVVPSMRRVVSALLTALPGMVSIAALLVLVLYVAGVMATKLFSRTAPEYFGNLGESVFTLFQIMTGDGWSEVARQIMARQPLAWIFFIAFLVVSAFTVLNLFIAVAVSAMEAEHRAEEEGQVAAGRLTATVRNSDVLEEVRALRAELRELRSEVRGELRSEARQVERV
ncbi:MAG: ion transporter [Hamadaea sp.]|nr:ion transporter [Hamadaea sp.]